MSISKIIEYVRFHGDRFIVIFTPLFAVTGLLANRYRISHAPSDPLLNYLSLLYMVFYASLCIIVIFSVSKYKVDIERWGFTLHRKTWISVGLGLAILVSLCFRGGLQISMPETFEVLPMAIGAIGEELLNRVLLITALANMFLNAKKLKGPLAILVSSVIFTVPHIHERHLPISNLIVNVFVLALIFGTVFYYSKSNFFPIVTHITFNTYPDIGVFAGVVFAIIYFVLVMGKKMLIRVKTSKGLRLNSR